MTNIFKQLLTRARQSLENHYHKITDLFPSYLFVFKDMESSTLNHLNSKSKALITMPLSFMYFKEDSSSTSNKYSMAFFIEKQ